MWSSNLLKRRKCHKEGNAQKCISKSKYLSEAELDNQYIAFNDFTIGIIEKRRCLVERKYNIRRTRIYMEHYK